MLIKQMAVALAGVIAFAACGEEDSAAPVETPAPKPCFDAAGMFTCGEGTQCVAGVCEPVDAVTEPSKPACAQNYNIIPNGAAGSGVDPSAVVQVSPGATQRVLSFDVWVPKDTTFDALLVSHSTQRFGQFVVRDVSGNEIGRATNYSDTGIAAIPVDLVLLAGQKTHLTLEVIAAEMGVQFGPSRLDVLGFRGDQDGDALCNFDPRPYVYVDIVEVPLPPPAACNGDEYQLTLSPTAGGQEGLPGDTLNVAKATISARVDARVKEIDVEAVGGWGALEILVNGRRPIGGGETLRGSYVSAFTESVELPTGSTYSFDVSARIVPNARTSQSITLIVRATFEDVADGSTGCDAGNPPEIVVKVLEPQPTTPMPTPTPFPSDHPCAQYDEATRPPMIVLLDGPGSIYGPTGNAEYMALYKFVACADVNIVRLRATVQWTGSSGSSAYAGLIGPTNWNVSPFYLAETPVGGVTYATAFPRTESGDDGDERAKVLFDSAAFALDRGNSITLAIKGDAQPLPSGFVNTVETSLDWVEVQDRATGTLSYATIAAAPVRRSFVGQ